MATRRQGLKRIKKRPLSERSEFRTLPVSVPVAGPGCDSGGCAGDRASDLHRQAEEAHAVGCGAGHAGVGGGELALGWHAAARDTWGA